MRAPMPYRAEEDQQDQVDQQDPTLNPDKANANDNGSSTPPAPKPYTPPTDTAVKANTPIATTQVPTFAQMQANGEARPPMPTPEPAQNPSAAPVGPQKWSGTPMQTQSFNLPNGATQFPGADGKGQTAGGTSGTGWATFDQSKATPMSASDQSLYNRIQSGDQSLMNEYKQKYGNDWFSKWGADQDRLSAMALNQTGSPDVFGGLKGKSAADAWSVVGGDLKNLNAVRAMTPDQRRQLLSQYPEGSYDRAVFEGALAAQGITVDSGDTGQRWDGTTQNNGPMAPAVPVYQQTQAGTVNSQGLAGYGAGATPSSRSSGTLTPNPQVATPSTTPVAPRPPVLDQNTDQGGQGVPPMGGVTATPGKVANVPVQPGSQSATPDQPGANPTSTDVLGMLMKGAQGQGAGSQVQNATQDAILNQLKNPNAYNSDAVKSAYDWMGGNIDDQYALQEKDLQEEMARRGLSTSTIGAGRLADLNIGKRSAKSQLAQDLGQKMAESQQSATGQAIAQGIGGGTQAQNSQMDWLKNLMGYGQQGFENDMSTAKFNADQNNQWQQFLMQMLGQGYGTSGA